MKMLFKFKLLDQDQKTLSNHENL